MRLEPALDRWMKAGLIDQNIAASIRAFEVERVGLHPALMALAALGGFAIVLGAIALVGANWSWLPSSVKLGGTIAAGIGLAAGLTWAETRKSLWISEAIRLVFVGWILGAIAVVGQVFQLDGSAPVALAWWTVLAAPAFSYTRSYLGGIAFSGLLFVGCLAVREVFFGGLAEESDAWLLLVYPAVVASALNLPIIKRHRPELASSSLWFLGACAVLNAFVAANVIAYADDQFASPSALIPLALGALATAAFVSRWRPMPGPWACLAMVTTYAMASSWVVGGIDAGELGATLLSVLLLGALAAGAYESGRTRLFKCFTFLIAVRIFVMYSLYAADLNNLGLSLLGGGVVMLVLAGAWHRSMQQLDTLR